MRVEFDLKSVAWGDDNIEKIGRNTEFWTQEDDWQSQEAQK